MATKASIFSSVISGSPMITSEKLVGSENYLSWSASVELWFMGQGYEDHLVTQKADIPEVDRVQWRKIDAQLSNQDLDLSTYIGQIASLKEEFLTVMPLTPDVGAQQTQLDKFFMVLTLIGLRPDLEPVRDQILGSSSVPSLDDVFARLLPLEEAAVVPEVEVNVLIAPIAINLATLAIVAISYMDGLLALPMWPSPLILRCLSLPSSSASQASVASVAQPGNASACLTHTSSLGPWILDSGASDHLSGNKDLFSSITTTSALPNVTLANGSQTVAKGPEYREDDGIGRESQGLYHLTSDSSPAVCISTDAPLLIHNRLGHPSLSKFQKMVPRFPLCRRFRLNARIDILLRQLVLSSSIVMFLFVFGGTLFLPLVIWINRMPSSVLHDQIPHSLLFPDQPLYFLPPHVFGCTCFVHILTPGQDKLSAKAMKCLFLGYSRLQKGYRCYSLETHRYFISADVTFFEDSPFFSTTSESLPVSEVLSIPIVSPPAQRAPMKLFPIQAGDRQWWMKWLLCTLMALGILLFYPLVDSLKARLVAKGYTQVYGSDYGDTFSPVAKIASVHLLLSMAAMCSWPLYQLDIKNVFLHGDLAEEVYMEQPPDQRLGKLKYFLGIEIAQSSSGVVLSQRKYALDILEETGMLDCKPVDTPMDPNVKLVPGQGEPLGDPGDIDGSHWDVVIRILRYIKSSPGQGVLYENRGHTQVVGYTDADWTGSPTDRRSTSGYCVFIGGNLISWKSKKQDVVARSSAEAEYRVMALATCELIWLRHLLRELRFGKDEQMKLICDNQAALHIASNPVFHERTKHIEVDCHFIREKIESGCVATSFVNSNDQLADIFTKSLRGPKIKYICNKLGAYDVYAPA
ncbi:Retrovirus-related Pol polyprotein from transposon RE2 [Vitis vinifera]|uniref:Retrovirus-related Pol polyprotein from transposon RE2 n=1 Tax=Vitis vinifera TaxID=29760 RepID=A0A438DFK2_VITVI|nr:Retrovirus-related Pol polyprotein from transposon RE2 [Vitis vinifera]